MARMKAIEAAVRVLEKEGVTCAFGVPGAAINPLYAALKARGTIRHILARHVEGASHMADGYTRAKAGNIGVCIGTSGPAGTDMITGLYAAIAEFDPDPVHHRAGAARQALQGGFSGRRHRDDRQAGRQMVGHRARAGARADGVPAGVPRHALGPARSGADRSADRRAGGGNRIRRFAPIQPLPVYKPAATPAQAARAIEMLNAAQRPLIVAGGGIINADAGDLLVEFAELTGVPVIPTLMGWGTIPDDHPLMAGMVGLQTSHRYGNATFLESDFVFGIGNRFANRHTGSVDVYTNGRKFIHVDIEPTQIGRVFGPDFGIVSDARAALEQFIERRARNEGGRAR